MRTIEFQPFGLRFCRSAAGERLRGLPVGLEAGSASAEHARMAAVWPWRLHKVFGRDAKAW